MLVVDQGDGVWGAQRYFLRLAPLLAVRGYTCILAAPDDGTFSDAWRTAGFEQVHLNVPPDRRVRRSDDGRPYAGLIAREVGRTALGAAAIARLAKQTGASVVSANSHWAHLEGALASKIVRVPCVLHLHEQTIPGIAGRLRAASVRMAAATIAVSNAVANDLPAATRARVQVIHNGIDARAFSPAQPDPAIRAELAADPDEPIVLVVNRLDPLKGVDDTIRAVAGLTGRLKSTQLAIAGSGSLDPSWAESLHCLGAEKLGGRVRFLGVRTDVYDLLRSSNVFVLASRREGLPLGILEAQAVGVPVLAYPIAGVPEVVTHDSTGLLARQDDVADLQRQLERLLIDPKLGARLAATARTNVLANFTLEGQADRLAEVFDSVVGPRPPRT